MPEKKLTQERGEKLKQTVDLLADRLAIAMCYLEAIDRVIEPFTDLERGKSLLIDGLIHRAKVEIYGHYDLLYAPDSRKLIEVHTTRALKATETDTFTMHRKRIIEMAKKEIWHEEPKQA